MKKIITDGNGAAAYVAYAFTEIAAIYPITPSSPMAELADEWSTAKKPNLWGEVAQIIQMQSESGAAGVLHGALTCGALCSTFTCSQGLLLMIPDMYKIAGELLPTVFHVSARALSTHALSIFGDHQDVMACRQTGFAMLASSSVQEAMDLALVAHLATLKTSVPFLHFFDGFRTSHESCKIDAVEYDEIRTLFDERALEKFRHRALSPQSPVQRGTAQNPDVYFQNREAANPYYLSVANTVQTVMDEVAKITKRAYRVFDYFGAPDAEYVTVLMGSGASTMEETVEKLNADGWKTGLIKVRLYRPFDGAAFIKAIPKSCKKIIVLDRTKEAGAQGEPLYLDVRCALAEHGAADIEVYGGRYGLGSKEFTPTMCLAVFENAKSTQPKNHFTVGINDDVTNLSLPLPAPYFTTSNDCISCKFYGLGSDGTVGANKNSVQIIGENTALYVQAYFYYDSKKSGGATVSHLRFGKSPIRSAYLIDRADFIACHNPSYLTRYDMLKDAKPRGTFLLNCPATTLTELENYLPKAIKKQIAEKELTFYVINATQIAEDVGLSGRTSTVMQAAFFLLSPHILPYDIAKRSLQEQLRKKFAKKGEETVRKNISAVERAENAVQKINYPTEWKTAQPEPSTPTQNEYFEKCISPVLRLEGDNLPVSAFSPDGSVPTGTTKYEKHGVAAYLPLWIEKNCIQCNQCAFVCPHATIRPFIFDEHTQTPFPTLPTVGKQGTKFRIQVAAEYCMGCGVCADVCPTKEKALVMRPMQELFARERANWEFAQSAPTPDIHNLQTDTVKGSQFRQPLFEFSYACSGCGETPYIKLLTQLFGEKMLIANATGCSSIYGGSSPTCPYTTAPNGSGPAWASSLFEDNAEFGLGMRLACDYAADTNTPKKSVWIIGGDGWAYDIGYGGLDHVLALGKNVNILVLDSEVYSNTGGQASKATPFGATARFASRGKQTEKKQLGLMAMTYGNVYVAQVSMGANRQQCLQAFLEAEKYDGVSLIIAYSPCIAHGVNMQKCMQEERLAVESGYFPLYRFNPDLKKQNKNPFILDSKAPTVPLRDFYERENRFSTLTKQTGEKELTQAELTVSKRFAFYQKLSTLFE